MKGDRTRLHGAALFVLAAHCVERHGLKAVDLADAISGFYERDQADLRVVHALASDWKAQQAAALEAWDALGAHAAGGRVVNMLGRALPDEGFAAFLEEMLATGRLQAQPRLLAGLIPVIVNVAKRINALEWFRTNLQMMLDVSTSDTIWWLIHGKPFDTRRDELLKEALRLKGEGAARQIIDLEGWSKDPPRIVLEATMLLEKENPTTNEYPVGLSASLRFDAEYALPRIVELAHGKDSNRMYGGSAGHNLGSWPNQDRLFDALARDSGKKSPGVQELFARIDQDLCPGTETVTAWLEANAPTDQTQTYHAAALMELLSDENLDTESGLGQRVIRLAEIVHAKFGTRSERDALVASRASSQKTSARFPRYRALALAKDVLRGEPELPAADQILARLKKDFPRTYEAFGGAGLDQFLAKGERMVGWWWYEDGHEAGYETATTTWDEAVKSGTAGSTWAGFAARHHAVAILQREAWEKRFAQILDQDDYHIKQKELRQEPTYWTELWLHAAFLDHFDRVEREVTDVPGLEAKRPDFRLTAPEGKLIVEVTEAQEGPSSLVTGVRASLGMNLQKQVDDKWDKQFRKCAGDPGMPVIIAVRVSHGFDLDFDLTNSLYGALAFSWSGDPATGKTVAEGSTRHDDKGFYNRKEVACISGVIGFHPAQHSIELVGDLFSPIRAPLHPVPPRLWARLRTAMFGSRPEMTMKKWRGLPDISEDEIGRLVDAGFDEPGMFIGGAYQHDETVITAERWAAVARTVRVRTLLERFGRLADLPGLPADVVKGLADLGLHTLGSLDHAKEIPEAWRASVGAAKHVWGFKAQESEEK